MSKHICKLCSVEPRPIRLDRSDPVFQTRGLLLVCAVVVAAFLSASFVTVQSVRAAQLPVAAQETPHPEGELQHEQLLAFSFLGPISNPAETGFGAAAARGYASEVGPSPLPFIQSGFGEIHNFYPAEETNQSPLSLFFLLGMMFVGMLMVTVAMWRETGKRAARIITRPTSGQSRFHH